MVSSNRSSLCGQNETIIDILAIGLFSCCKAMFIFGNECIKSRCSWFTYIVQWSRAGVNLCMYEFGTCKCSIEWTVLGGLVHLNFIHSLWVIHLPRNVNAFNEMTSIHKSDFRWIEYVKEEKKKKNGTFPEKSHKTKLGQHK